MEISPMNRALTEKEIDWLARYDEPLKDELVAGVVNLFSNEARRIDTMKYFKTLREAAKYPKNQALIEKRRREIAKG